MNYVTGQSFNPLMKVAQLSQKCSLKPKWSPSLNIILHR